MIHTNYNCVCTFSCMTSGLISPSGIPDSPSEIIAPSLRRITTPPLQPLLPDRVDTSLEENVSPEFSRANRLSDLILHDEPMIINEITEGQDAAADNLYDIVNTSTIQSECALAANASTDSDDDSDNDSLLLEKCMARGMNLNISKNDNVNINSNEPPPLPPRIGMTSNGHRDQVTTQYTPHNDPRGSDGSDTEYDDILQLCIQNGMEKASIGDGIVANQRNKEHLIGRKVTAFI